MRMRNTPGNISVSDKKLISQYENEKFCQAARHSLPLTELLLMLHQIRADPLLQGFHQFFLVCGTYQKAFFFRV